jgi:hypothetical protein
MQLLAAHQILIGAAIALAALFGVRSLAIFASAGGTQNLALGLISFVVAVALGLYFRTVRAKWLEQRGGGRP